MTPLLSDVALPTAVPQSPAEAPPSIEVHNISKRFGSLQTLQDVSMKLRPGSFRALLGENGAGKSTLVKCIMGTYRADTGSVRVGTQDVELKNPRQSHALGIGMVYQPFTLVENMTVVENMLMAREYVPAVVKWKKETEQRDFIAPGGFGAALGNDVSRLAPIVPAVAALLSAFRERGLTVVHTKECHRPDLADCPPAKRSRGRPGLRIGDNGPMGRILVEGEPGNDFVALLKPRQNELVIPKPGKGSFHATTLQDGLHRRGITHLLITGVTTEVCVQTSMREANDRGYECLLVEDATESYFPEFKQATLEMVRAQGGIVGWTATTKQVLAALATCRQ